MFLFEAITFVACMFIISLVAWGRRGAATACPRCKVWCLRHVERRLLLSATPPRRTEVSEARSGFAQRQVHQTDWRCGLCRHGWSTVDSALHLADEAVDLAESHAPNVVVLKRAG